MIVPTLNNSSSSGTQSPTDSLLWETWGVSFVTFGYLMNILSGWLQNRQSYHEVPANSCLCVCLSDCLSINLPLPYPEPTLSHDVVNVNVDLERKQNAGLFLFSLQASLFLRGCPDPYDTETIGRGF